MISCSFQKIKINFEDIFCLQIELRIYLSFIILYEYCQCSEYIYNIYLLILSQLDTFFKSFHRWNSNISLYQFVKLSLTTYYSNIQCNRMIKSSENLIIWLKRFIFKKVEELEYYLKIFNSAVFNVLDTKQGSKPWSIKISVVKSDKLSGFRMIFWGFLLGLLLL